MNPISGTIEVFSLATINTATQFHWSLQVSEASPRSGFVFLEPFPRMKGWAQGMRLAFDTVVYQPKIDSLILKPLHVNLGIRLERFHCSPTSTIITKLSSSQNETTLL